MDDIHRFTVVPAYRQVEVRDAADDVDYPQWETGEERVLVSAQCIVLATRSDLQGDVEIEVRVDAGLGGWCSLPGCSGSASWVGCW
jgi:hypothetical protein